jgi:hypothetical protein
MPPDSATPLFYSKRFAGCQICRASPKYGHDCPKTQSTKEGWMLGAPLLAVCARGGCLDHYGGRVPHNNPHDVSQSLTRTCLAVMGGSQHLKNHRSTDCSDPLWIFEDHRGAHVCSIFGGLCKVCITTQYCSVFACNALICSSVACGARTSKMTLML